MPPQCGWGGGGYGPQNGGEGARGNRTRRPTDRDGNNATSHVDWVQLRLCPVPRCATLPLVKYTRALHHEHHTRGQRSLPHDEVR